MMRGIFKSMLAGTIMGIGCYAYLNVGGIIGAALLAFSYIIIISCECVFFTSRAGCVDNFIDMCLLFITLIFNIVGCILISEAFNSSSPELAEISLSIMEKRVSLGCLNCFMLAILSGILITMASYFVTCRDNWLPLVFSMPLLVMCDFTHCISDAFYFVFSHKYDYISIYYDEWLCTVAGNFVGCHLWRLHTK